MTNENTDSYTGAMAELPRYRCHKVVHAFKIGAIEIPPMRAQDEDAGFRFLRAQQPCRVTGKTVSPEYMVKHRPKEGGYYVVYDGGYDSFSPADAFEDGYIPLDSSSGLVTIDVPEGTSREAYDYVRDQLERVGTHPLQMRNLLFRLAAKVDVYRSVSQALALAPLVPDLGICGRKSTGAVSLESKNRDYDCADAVVVTCYERLDFGISEDDDGARELCIRLGYVENPLRDRNEVVANFTLAQARRIRDLLNSIDLDDKSTNQEQN